ncbi:hypothetical protein Hanom_Chr16g01425751 [Helianthus anomalus]
MVCGGSLVVRVVSDVAEVVGRWGRTLMMVGDAEVAGWWSEMRGVVWLQVGEKLGTMKGFCLGGND